MWFYSLSNDSLPNRSLFGDNVHSLPTTFLFPFVLSQFISTTNGSNSALQIIDRDGEPFFELELNDKPTLFSPKEVVKMIFQKLFGRNQFY